MPRGEFHPGVKLHNSVFLRDSGELTPGRKVAVTGPLVVHGELHCTLCYYRKKL